MKADPADIYYRLRMATNSYVRDWQRAVTLVTEFLTPECENQRDVAGGVYCPIAQHPSSPSY
jgi:hypothetical protein